MRYFERRKRNTHNQTNGVNGADGAIANGIHNIRNNVTQNTNLEDTAPSNVTRNNP